LDFETEKHMFAVFDGHGGGEVAKYSKRHFEEGLRQMEEFKQSDYKEGLRRGFLDIDVQLNSGGLEEVAKTKRDNPPTKSPLMKILTDVSGKKKADTGGEDGEDDLNLDSIGCTANVVMIDYSSRKVWVANAGDSRCVMGKGGRAIPLSFDHKPECEVEIARIEAAGSVIQEGRVDGHLNLTRALGDLKFKKKPGLTAE
jgi:protein phosphatase 1G